MEDIAILVIVENGEVTVKGPIGADVRMINYDIADDSASYDRDQSGRPCFISTDTVTPLETEQERREYHYLRVLTGRD